ncbi:MAG TPA: LuxR C-terminal-related transcriptional regulator [Candidatus Saccharimonadales bacterium]
MQANKRAGLFLSLPPEMTAMITEGIKAKQFTGKLSLQFSLGGDAESLALVDDIVAVPASTIAKASRQELKAIVNSNEKLLLIVTGKVFIEELEAARQRLQKISKEAYLGHLIIPEDLRPPDLPPLYPYGLTPRQTQVLHHMASFLSYEEIARQMYVSVNTVKTHVFALFKKLEVNSRQEAVARGRALNILPE